MTTPHPEQQIEPRDDLLSFAASANELAERIRRGEGADLGRLVGAIVQERADAGAEALPKAA
ncbi:MAG: hypothetical protein R3B57_13005 [Phycisphaerales bacterium]